MAFISACGSSESASPPRGINIDTTGGKSFRLSAFDPVQYAINATSRNPLVLAPANRPLALFQFDAVVPANLNEDRVTAADMITGIAINVVDSKGAAVRVSLAIEAREFNSKTGLFSSTTQIFTAPGQDLSGAQNFVILNTNSPNYVLTGLALRLMDAKVSNLSLLRKSISSLGREVTPPEGGTVVTLPAGWAAVGLSLKFDPVTLDSGAQVVPFVQDALLSIAQLVEN